MHVFINMDLNGTILIGDALGHRTTNEYILIDLLKCFSTESSTAFIQSLKSSELNKLLNQQLKADIDLQSLLQQHANQFNCFSFYENFELLLSLCIRQCGSKVKQNDLIRFFLQTEMMPDKSVPSMMMDHVLADKDRALDIRNKIGLFYPLMDDACVVKSFYRFATSISKDKAIHMTLNTFGSDAPTVISKLRDIIPCSREITAVKTPTLAEKKEAATTIFNSAVSSQLISLLSNYEQFDEQAKINRYGKLFPINSDKKGLYVFFDDNLSFDGLDRKGCVTIFDIASSQEIDFSKSTDFTAEHESAEVKAVLCGKAVIVLVKARLSYVCQDTYFIDLVNKYKRLAEIHYQAQAAKTNPHQLFTTGSSVRDTLLAMDTELQPSC
ncbi:hypothetical protein [Legionella shakespearei]|uniref:Uncharacterized protein n=1 Tax=Legionella shakespearei DSM 23087 TaxID=1122169 RepID=A0A0W0YLH6_9GAMM|nr:hypothetical protein [Legionella shakespearei]KTD57675.1 hypothetical protein Lsha_2516 [Legionella shakespearei DSM 23087]